MKEQDLDKYVGELVKITDLENDINYGKLYKIKNHIVNRYNKEEIHSVKDGYFLDGYTRSIDYRKSHIKKIEIV